MILRKYLTTILFAVLAIGFTIIVDILIGLPWNNFIINWNYSLTDPAEQVVAVFLLLFLVVPDIVQLGRHKRNRQEQRSGKSDRYSGQLDTAAADEAISTTGEQSASGPTPGTDSVNQGSNNQGGGKTDVK